MNQQLSNIELLIQQSALTDEEKQKLLKEISNADKQWNILEFKLDRTEKVKKTTSVLLEETIEELEKKRKDVEAQNKELEIQNALERVRAVALGMKEPADMLEICKTISQQLQLLHVKEIRNVQTAIFYEGKGTYMNYEYYAKHDKTIITETSFTNHKMHRAFAMQMLKGKGEFFTTYISKEELPDWIAYQKTTNVFIDDYLNTATSLNYYWYSLGAVALGISTYEPLKDEDINLFKRFLKVFELSYTRYLDIEQAEAQAREAQIQLALERVRARTMAMQKSDELTETALLLFEQLQSLGAVLWSCGFNIWEKGKAECTSFITRAGKMLEPVKLFLNENPVLQLFNESRQNEEEFWYMQLSGEDCKSVFGYVAKQRQLQTGDNIFLSEVTMPSSQITHLVNFSYGNLMFITLEPHPEFHNIFKRFGKVFEQTYTRFLDLQKAEAQAREAQIEAALEKVRSRSLAVHKSDEFNEVIKVVFERLQELEISMTSASINVVIKDSKDTDAYICGSGEDGLTLSHIRLIYFDHPIANDRYDAHKKGIDFFTKTYSAEEKNSFYEHAFAVTALKHIPDDIKKMVMESERYTISIALNKNSMIVINDFEGKLLSEKNIEIVKRFSRVFEQAYIRFLDLQKAEAQTRESEIELGLERVRARAMAMQTSEELNALIGTVFTELTKLDLVLTRCVILIYEGNEKGVRWWMANSETPSTPMNFFVKYADMPFFNEYLKGWYNRELKWQYCLEDENKIRTDDFLFNETELSLLPDFVIEGMKAPDRVYLNASFNNFGNLTLATLEPLSQEHFNILLRFAKVFDLTYTRFNDLKQAEAQARESQIQLALERVRARTMAMQKSDELSETVYLLFQQFRDLGENPDQATIGIINEDENVIEYWVTMYGQPINKVFKFSIEEPNVTNKIYKAWKENKKSLVIDLNGDALTEFMTYRASKGGAAVNPSEKRRIINVAFFSKGLLNVQSNEERSAESIKLLERFAAVFEQTYTRFLDLQKAEAQSRESQIQLALERARAQSMMMQHSTELDDTLRVFHEQVLQLNIPSAFSFLWLPDEEKDKHIFWAAWAENNSTVFKSKAINYPLDRTEPATAQCLIDWKSNQPVVSYHVPPDGVPGYFAAWSELIAGVEQLKPEHFSEGLYYIEAFMKYGCFGVMVKHPLNDDEKKILERFAIEFERAYTRFLDLQKAEAQAREAQIEAALERVRSRTMGMQKSEELQEVIRLVYEQFIHLNIHIEHTGFLIDYKERDDLHIWLADEHLAPSEVTIPWFDSPPNNSIKEAKEKGRDFFFYHLNFEEKNKFYQELFTFVPGVPEETLEYYLTCPGLAGSGVLLENIGLYIENFSGTPYSDEENAILMRFGKVFQQTYTRFLDLQKAEAQAREAQIEAALERVRSKSLAMHHTSEIQDVIHAVHNELLRLNISILGGSFIVVNKDIDKQLYVWGSGGTADTTSKTLVPDFGMPFCCNLINGIKKGPGFFTEEFSQKEKIDYFTELFKHEPWSKLSTEEKKAVLESEGTYTRSVSVANYTSIFIINHNGRKFTDEENDILKRFSKVFEQSYVRFLDLEKAEAQAREAQIEAALERVRSRTMAMHKSSELTQTAEILFDQLRQLGAELQGVAFAICDENSLMVQKWTSIGIFSHPYDIEPGEQRIYEAWKKGEGYYEEVYEGERQKKYYEAFMRIPEFRQGLQKFIDSGYPLPTWQKNHAVTFKYGYLLFITLKPFNETNIFIRFGKVFEQTYTRFLDLQKAEAQTREAQIEAALERVRAKAMAMQNSQDLSDTIGVFYRELQSFSLTPRRCGVGLLDRDDRIGEMFTWNTTEQGDSLELVGRLKMEGHPVLNKVYESWLTQTEYHPVLRGNEIKKYCEILKPQIAFPDYTHNDVQFGYFFFFPEGGVYAWTEKEMQEDELQIYRRFTSVLSLTYKRYRDLQKAETNAREAIKQAALDRIRADIASMRTVSDLDRITPLIWNELTILGIPFIRCGVFIMDDEQQLIHTFLSTPDGKAIAAFHLPYSTPGNIQKVISHWHDDKSYIDHWDENDFAEFAKMLVTQGALTSSEQYLKTIPHGGFCLHFLPFLQGMLYVGNTNELSEDEINLIQSLADAFSTAYARYEDFNKLEAAKKQVDKTLVELKQTQQQLVQSEKMASLGELTAGIAHEIQNPLNFVNNFSEVSNELIEELKMKNEKLKIEDDEVTELLNDIAQNLEKINHHGKRADAIVKGMLQHSRKNSGQKEPTDINALCDEYIRLSFHGMRAKDKSFNADFKTGFDETIGKINIIPQDIGRVLLNLFNNAFYAVKPPDPLKGEQWKPLVSVSTRRITPLQGKGAAVEIRVEDNGNGIPQTIIDKIFQPFFTTKPTGSGTGLGLSLSYDIVKAHGGEIKVETKQNEGTTFIIQLPITA